MKILVSGATTTVGRLAHSVLGQDHLGHLVTPQNGNTLGQLLRTGLPWACDNAAFSNPDDRKFWNMVIDSWEWLHFNPPMWIAVPDIVCNHAATVELFESWLAEWEYEIGDAPWPLAFVLQNGATIDSVPWDRIECVFVGGDDTFKLKDCLELVDHAKQLGKLVHVGRVNTLCRIRYAFDLGADTIDGTGFSMYPDKKIERALKEIARVAATANMFAA